MRAQALLKVTVEALLDYSRSQVYAYDEKRLHAVLTVKDTDITDLSRNHSFLARLAKYGLNAEDDDPQTLLIFEDGGTFTAFVMYRKLRNKSMFFIEIN